MREIEKIKFFFQSELKSLLNTIKKHSFRDYVIFFIAYRHGLRATEVGLLKTYDIDFDGKRIYVRRLKNSISCLHPLPDDERRILKKYIEKFEPDEILFYGKTKKVPISRKTLDKKMRKYGKLAGLPKDKIHFHSLRHSFGVHLIQAGVDIRVVQVLLGHKNIQNTVIYTHIADTMREKAMIDAISSGQLV